VHPEFVNQMLNFATGPFQTHAQLIAQMAMNASTPFQVNIASPLKAGQLPCPPVNVLKLNLALACVRLQLTRRAD
jgi:hypothetical protein